MRRSTRSTGVIKSHGKNGRLSPIPPSSTPGPLNTKSLRVTLSPPPDIRDRKPLPRDLARQLLAEANERRRRALPWPLFDRGPEDDEEYEEEDDA